MGYVVSVDQSTSATKAFLLDDRGLAVRAVSAPHRQSFPRPGYAEHDAEEIARNAIRLIAEITAAIAPGDIAALSITNQRETTVLWDRKTGEPLCPAIVWQDVRGADWCAKQAEHSHDIRQKTGLVLSPYYSAAKIAAALEQHQEWRQRDICVGTVDSYLIFRLTNGKSFYTDPSNASRTQLMNLRTVAWDRDLCAFFGVNPDWLAQILPSDSVFGRTEDGIPLCGVMGDSHAALYGHGCHVPGMAKATYGTGSSVMVNTGAQPVLASRGLSASVGFTAKGETCYVLEGNVTSSGDTLCWLRDQMGILPDIEKIEEIAATVDDTQGVSLVPAFSGLGAPYFREDARALLCGMNRGTTSAHILRAALESIAHQDADILEIMALETGAPIASLHADGGAAANRLLMQMQADFVPVQVQCAESADLSALGAGYMGGLAAGLYPSFDKLLAARGAGEVFMPAMDEKIRATKRRDWKMAVLKSIPAAEAGV
jgi:glycerol kinase